MEMQGRAISSAAQLCEEEIDLRRGPWTVDEDLILMNYIAKHGEGRWNSLARCAGLKRTGKSCRLRWLNYLRPDVRRGNITPEEQLLILELHCRWGNRWSKIAQQLPGRTDNEIKNYWRTRVQKHAKQLRCDVNSKQFKDIMRFLWMPRLMERIQAASAKSAAAVDCRTLAGGGQSFGSDMSFGRVEPGPESSCCAGSLSESISTMTGSQGMVVADSCCDAEFSTEKGGEGIQADLRPHTGDGWWPETSPTSPGGYAYRQDFPELGQNWGEDACHENSWSMEDIWQLLQ